MGSRLIRLKDGTLIEVEATEHDVQQISSRTATKVEETIDNVKPILVQACEPIMEAWKELSQEMHVEQAEVELGLSFEGEGNVFITRAKAGANLTVKLTLKPQGDK
jgi:hypothetical protein